MRDIYCPPCGGMVNRGGVCPCKEKPSNCPLERTEAEHYAQLAAPATEQTEQTKPE